MKKPYKKPLIITSISIIGTITLLFLAFMFGVFIAPFKFAEFFENAGFDNIAYNLYNRALKNTKIGDEMHFMVKKAIDRNNKADVIYYAGRIFDLDDKDYYSLVSFFSSENIKDLNKELNNFDENGKQKSRAQIIKDSGGVAQLEINDTKRLLVANENNYLKNAFVSALINSGRTKEAIEFAAADLKGYINGNKQIDATNSFVYSQIFNLGLLTGGAFADSNEVLKNLQTFYDKLKRVLTNETAEFLSKPNEGAGRELERLNLQLLNNRLMEVGNIINMELYNGAGEDGRKLEADIKAAKDAIKELSKLRSYSPIITNLTQDKYVMSETIVNWMA
jgi:hypothetical protein